MANLKSVYVIGCGGHAKVVVQVLRALDYHVAAVFDDDARKWNGSLLGFSAVGPVEQIVDHPPLPTVVAVGDNAVRRAIAARFDLEWLTLVHPRAVVDPTAALGPGTVVMAGAVVQADTRVGSHVIINTSASVDHDCTVGDYVHIAPGARVAGGVTVGDGCFLGLGAIILPERRVGAQAVVGAGAVVTRDVPEGVTVVGVPARVHGRSPRTADGTPKPGDGESSDAKG